MTARTFRIGQTVKVIAGPRRGLMTVITSGPWKLQHRIGYWGDKRPYGHPFYGIKAQKLTGAPGCVAGEPIENLIPIDPGREPAEWTEELRRLCGVGTPAKERA